MAEQDEDQKHRDCLIELHTGEKESGANTEYVPGAHGQHDQHRHIEHAVAKRAPGGDKERPARIEHGGTRQDEQPDV